MGNLEKPLTLGLALLFIIALLVVNCQCSDGTTWTLNNAFNISASDINESALNIDEGETITEEVETAQAEVDSAEMIMIEEDTEEEEVGEDGDDNSEE